MRQFHLVEQCCSEFRLKVSSFKRQSEASSYKDMHGARLFMAAFLSSMHETFSETGNRVGLTTFPEGFDAVLSDAFAKACNTGEDKLLGSQRRPQNVVQGFKKDASKVLKALYGEMEASPLAALPPESRKYMCIDPASLGAIERLDKTSKSNLLIPLVYENEPGYLRGMVDGWNFLAQKRGAEASVDLIAEMHKIACTATVPGKKEGFAPDHPAKFGLVPDLNVSESGRKELAAFASEMRAKIPELKEFGITHIEGKEYFQRSTMPEGKLEAIIKDWIDEYALQKAAAPAHENEEMALARIVDLCQKCERLHPFRDGNCRIFGNFLLNHLLVEEGLSPTILWNPNVIDGFSREEVIAEVKKGQAMYAGLLPVQAT